MGYKWVDAKPCSKCGRIPTHYRINSLDMEDGYIKVTHRIICPKCEKCIQHTGFLSQAILEWNTINSQDDSSDKKKYTSDELVECLKQIVREYGYQYLTMFGCTARVKYYADKLITVIKQR